jgi:hypothetical protein
VQESEEKKKKDGQYEALLENKGDKFSNVKLLDLSL